MAFAALAVVTISLAVLGYQLARQQGRLLLRLDALESQVGIGAQSPASNRSPQHSVTLGLPVGSTIENVTLKDLDGRPVALTGSASARLLLMYWSPSCGFCDLIAPGLAAVQDRLATATVQAMLVSHGDAAANRSMAQRHGLKLPILLLDGQRIAAFDQLGTPVAYLLDSRRRVIRPLAVGADDVLALARETAGPSRRRLPGEKPLTESVMLRDGIQAGTRAPGFALPDLNGRVISLDTFRGRRLLLVFSDPHCGPCAELTPELVAIDRAHRDNGLALVMVGRGDREENRQKAVEMGITFPVVVQEHWKLSKQYGIFATPVAFLIDADGRIEAPVAKGKDEILRLAARVLTREKELVG